MGLLILLVKEAGNVPSLKTAYFLPIAIFIWPCMGHTPYFCALSGRDLRCDGRGWAVRVPVQP
jgi:hypothetical protein